MSSRRNAVYLLTIACLITGLATGRAFFFSLAWLFTALLVISFIWAWLSVRGLHLGRKTRTSRSQVGKVFEEAFSIQNRSLLPKLWLEVRDHSTLPAHYASHVVPTLAGRRAYRWYVQTPCQVRGEFELGPLTIVSGDPFGFFTSPRRLGSTSRLVVYPQTIPLSHIELPIGQISGGDARRRRTYHVTTNAAGVRDYVPGDSFGRIHWRTSARKDKLIVKEFEIDPLDDIWLFVDFSASSLYEASTVERVGRTGSVIPTSLEIPTSTEEYSVVVAASLAQYFTNTERAIGFAAYLPHREILYPETGARQLNRILHALAVARSITPQTLTQMLALETPFFTRGTTLIIVTASLDKSWVIEGQILARRGIHPFVILVDPSSFGAPTPAQDMIGLLRLARIPVIPLRYQDDIANTLAQRPI